MHPFYLSAGVAGPFATFLNDPNAPEHRDPETLGRALFDNASFDDWASLFAANTFSVYFVTTAFLGLLAKGSEDIPGYTSSVINLGSISGVTKLAQTKESVAILLLRDKADNGAPTIQFAYNASKSTVTHLTKMLATELALKNIPIRVCSVAPGVFPSEMTDERVTPDMVEKHTKGIIPVPMGRSGT